MGQTDWRSGYLTENWLRHVLLRYVGLLTGLGATLQFLIVVPLLGVLPAPFMTPFYPVLVIGIAYWVISGRYRESLSIWLTLTVVILGMLWSTQLVSGALLLLTILTMIAIMALVVLEEDWNLVRRWYMFSFLLSVLFLVLSHVSPSSLMLVSRQRLGWLATTTGESVLDPNQTAMHAGFALLVALPVLINVKLEYTSRSERIIATLVVATALGVIILSESRSGFLAAIVAVGFAVFIGRAILQPRIIATAVVFGTLLLVGLMTASSSLIERFLSDDISTGGGRFIVWHGAVKAITRDVRSLLFGAGTASGEMAFGRHEQAPGIYLSGGIAPQVDAPGMVSAIGGHNSYLSWVLDFGILGLYLVAMAFMLAYVRARAVDKGQTFATAQGMFVLFVIMSLSLTVYLMNGVSIAAGGLTLAYIYYHRNRTSDSESVSDAGLCSHTAARVPPRFEHAADWRASQR